MIKSLLFSLSMLACEVSFASVSDLNLFFQRVQSQGIWSGNGTSQIYIGRFAGTYSILVDLQVQQNPDGSWRMTTDMDGVPPQHLKSDVFYRIDGNEIWVTAGQYTSVADIAVLSPTSLTFTVAHRDPVSGALVTNRRQMAFDNAGNLTVSARNFQNGENVQDYFYQLEPTGAMTAF
jgi:hypothetical protein